MKRIIAFIICAITLFCVSGCSSDGGKTQKIQITTTIFPVYDFARAVAGDKADIKMLIDPGTEVHAFEPSPSDIKSVYSAKAFFYIGGESDTWVQSMLNDVGGVSIALMEKVDRIYENGEPIHDEHIWTSPKNAVKMVNAICDTLCEVDPQNDKYYRKNTEDYCKKIGDVAAEIKEHIKKSDNKLILVADRFPFRYFTEEMGLSYKAAFGGCANSSDVSLKVMNELAETVRQNDLRSAYFVEMSNKNIANALSESTGVKLYELHSAHTVTADDFKSGVTYVDIMKRNFEAIKKGL